MNSTSAAALWRRGILILALVFVAIFSQSSDGQEVLTVGDEAATATAPAENDATVVVCDDMGDVTDLGELMEDATTVLVENSDAESIVMTEDIVDDVLVVDVASVAATDDTSSENTDDADSTIESNIDNAESIDDVGTTDNASEPKQESQAEIVTPTPVVQSGPYIDLLGDMLLSLEMVDEAHAQVHQHYTNDALSGKKVVGLYFSADW